MNDVALKLDVSDDPIKRLSHHLRRDELAEVGALFARLAESPDDLEDRFVFLERTFSRADQLDLLLDLLLSHSATTFSRLSLVAKAIKIGDVVHRRRDVRRQVSQLSRNRNGPIIRWRSVDYLKNILPKEGPFWPALWELKYQGIPTAQREPDFFDNAEKLSDRVDIPKPYLDYLYINRKDNSLSRTQWEQHVRTAVCVDHLMSDTNFDNELHSLTDPAANHEAFDPIISAKQGTLILVFHGGFKKIMLSLFEEWIKDGIILTLSSGHTNRIGVQHDHRAGLFVTLKALLQGKVILMAPDGHRGQSHSSMKMLDIVSPIGDGAAFLAYESRCNTAWYNMSRQKDRFVPNVVPGPSRKDNESYAEFKVRMLDFYARQIESVIVGDPWSLALRGRWSRLIK